MSLKKVWTNENGDVFETKKAAKKAEYKKVYDTSGGEVEVYQDDDATFCILLSNAVLLFDYENLKKLGKAIKILVKNGGKA